MTVAIMQPYFFPYLGYFQLVKAADEFIFLDNVNFIRKGWIHRNQLLVNGEPYLFTIPLTGASQNRLIQDIELADYHSWRSKFLKTVELAYKQAPFYQETMELVYDALKTDFRTISKLAASSIEMVSGALGLKTVFSFASSLSGPGSIGAEKRIIDLCLGKKAATYINPANGRHLYDEKAFEKAGIEIMFHRMNSVSYTQSEKSGFIPNLSIIDVMMFNSRETILKQLEDCVIE